MKKVGSKIKMLGKWILGILLLANLSCEKSETQELIVIRDCTGTYLRLKEKDYRVCNLEKLAPFPDGAKVAATFKRIDVCKGSANETIICYMLHENEGWIEVLKVN